MSTQKPRMVSGNIFHCRKNLWPPEEYISKSIVQLTGTGITELIALEMSKMTKEPIEESRKKIWLVDSKGLIVSLRINMSMSSVS